MKFMFTYKEKVLIQRISIHGKYISCLIQLHNQTNLMNHDFKRGIDKIKARANLYMCLYTCFTKTGKQISTILVQAQVLKY